MGSKHPKSVSCKSAFAGLEKDIECSLVDEYLTPRCTFDANFLDSYLPLPSIPDVQLCALPELECRIALSSKRLGLDGHMNELLERLTPETLHALGLTRAIGSRRENVRGKSGQMPFTPGGLEVSATTPRKNLHKSAHGLLDQAPGLSRPGLVSNSVESTLEALHDLRLQSAESESEAEYEEGNDDEDDDEDEEEEQEEKQGDEYLNRNSRAQKSVEEQDPLNLGSKRVIIDSWESYNIDNLLPNFAGSNKKAPLQPQKQQKEWAHIVDIDQEFENFDQLVPHPARGWPFELDNFQKEAIFHLEQGDSVFVAAHTSAGKTVVAEYAMSMAVRHMTRCIYTSPIKALSNQKYRDFTKEYDDIGILTGDVQLNPEATTLIMTTEILRSMLYRGADIIRDVEFIIFDEVHYVNDSKRGVVWEEVIIMLPDHIKLVLLSATVPNTWEFANWIGRTKQKNVFVIATPHRPVPLKHYLWAGTESYEVVDSKRRLNRVGWEKARNALSMSRPAPKSGKRETKGAAKQELTKSKNLGVENCRNISNTPSHGKKNTGRNGMGSVGPKKITPRAAPRPSKKNFIDLFRHLKTENLFPAVIFVFSRRMAEEYAAMVLQHFDLSSKREKHSISKFVDNATSRLHHEDRNLPQIQQLRQLLDRGIGVHHSGLLPIMKEVVEILFSKGLVKILFATETFAMGLNLPTRTVVFSAISKFDSQSMRWLSPGEYTQMAGRAGRRGLDSAGTVIIMNPGSQVWPQDVLEDIVLGTPTKLSSQFRLTYTMILQLLRIEAVTVEDVIQQSFSENASSILRPELERSIVKAQQEISKRNLQALDCLKGEKHRLNSLVDLWRACSEYENYHTQLYELAFMIKGYFIGHVIVFRQQGLRYVGIVTQRPKLASNIVTVHTIAVSDSSSTSNNTGRRSRKSQKMQASLIPMIALDKKTALPRYECAWKPYAVPIPSIEHVSKLSTDVYALSKKEDQDQSLRYKIRIIKESLERRYYPQEPTSLKSLRAPEARHSLSECERLGALITGELLPRVRASGPLTLEQWSVVDRLGLEEVKLAALKAKAEPTSADLLPDYEQRLAMLMEADYIDDNLIVLLKGRVACEITTDYELYVTELVLNNFFASFEPEEVVALLSAFVFEGVRGADDSDAQMTPNLEKGRLHILEIVEQVNTLATAHGVQLTSEESTFAEQNRFALVQVVYEWARGLSFGEITTLTSVQEGLIVRVINRLDEVCRAVMAAARIIGDADLYEKLSIAQVRIKRNIVFCSSLYL